MNNPVLIDRNRMLKQLADCKSLPKMRYTLKDIQDFILAQPTAYDIDKVVEQLEELKNENGALGEMDWYAGLAQGFHEAIEIVKGGAE